MNNVDAKVEVNSNPATANGGTENPLFDPLKMALPGAFRGIAEQSVVRVKENCEKMKVVSGEVADVLRETYSTNAKGAADYGVKVIEISRVNATSALEFFTDLIGAKSPSEIMERSVTQVRKNLDAAFAQNKELWDLTQKVAIEATEPMKKRVAGVLPKVD